MASADRDRDARGRPRNARPRDELGRPLPRDAANRFVEEELPADPATLLRLGVEHFNAQRFFQAHEAWETAWHPSPDEERDFWQGATQVAVGLTHAQRDNPHGAVTLLRRGATKLSTYPAHYKGFPAADVARAACAAADAIERGEPFEPPHVELSV
ncbi:MAG: DUF309 domain-containing protein [Actinomycetota bacterium]|nr:DUF309 domain-containing protein [Actinomycetota bacterium]